MEREAARLGATQSSFEAAAETMERLVGVGISASSVWRHLRGVGTELKRELEREEQEVPFYVAWEDVAAMEWIAPQVPIEDHASVSIDGVKILTREDGFREVKMVSVSEVVARRPSSERASDSGESRGKGRGFTEPAAEDRGRGDDIKLTTHSYRAVLGDKATFVSALKGELARRRVRRADKISTPNDGADWIWDLVDKYVPARRVEILDWPHAVENLAKAGKAGWGEGTPEAQAWLEQRKTELWQGNVVQVEIALDELPRRYKERGNDIRKVKAYVDRHAQRLRYDLFRAEGRPIGSGTVESAARNVIAWRMKRGGQRWSTAGAAWMLVVLGEIHSRRWETRMQRMAKAA